jgi:hypothetical protein
MTTICPTCRTELEPGSPSAIGVALKNHIESNGGWDQGFTEDHKYRFDTYTADIVKVKDSWGDPNSDRYEDYSYIHQGDTFEAFVVFRVGDFFFKKTGQGDSYGEVDWDGDFTPVTMKVKTIEVYEFGAN